MQATFLVTLETEGDTDLLSIAEQIKFVLEDRYSVQEVKPWSRQQLSLEQPQQQTQ